MSCQLTLFFILVSRRLFSNAKLRSRLRELIRRRPVVRASSVSGSEMFPVDNGEGGREPKGVWGRYKASCSDDR